MELINEKILVIDDDIKQWSEPRLDYSLGFDVDIEGSSYLLPRETIVRTDPMQ